MPRPSHFNWFDYPTNCYDSVMILWFNYEVPYARTLTMSMPVCINMHTCKTSLGTVPIHFGQSYVPAFGTWNRRSERHAAAAPSSHVTAAAEPRKYTIWPDPRQHASAYPLLSSCSISGVNQVVGSLRRDCVPHNDNTFIIPIPIVIVC
jgi:hypothetical protein